MIPAPDGSNMVTAHQYVAKPFLEVIDNGYWGGVDPFQYPQVIANIVTEENSAHYLA